MSIIELHQALDAAQAAIGKPIDLLGMDACLMAMLEVAYETRGCWQYMVASEDNEYRSWPYDDILNALAVAQCDLCEEKFNVALSLQRKMLLPFISPEEGPSLRRVSCGERGLFRSSVASVCPENGILGQTSALCPYKRYICPVSP